MNITDRYVNLLIKQYWEKPKAKAEIQLKANQWQKLFEFYNSFEREFDLDFATGRQLDTLGKIVGVRREVPEGLPKIRFGFEGQDDAEGFADAFDPNVVSAPFQDLFEPSFTSLQLDDAQYRFFIRAKIAVNYCAAVMLSDDRLSLQDVIQSLFGGQAYVIDNLDMALFLFLGGDVDQQVFRLIRILGLLPKPQGVDYRFVFDGGTDSFAFDDDTTGLGFGDVFDPSVGGRFSELLFF